MDHEHINKQMAAIKATLEDAGYAVTEIAREAPAFRRGEG